jgi:TRAP-type C4-dicarboxylate transport system substrate-binding protein
MRANTYATQKGRTMTTPAIEAAVQQMAKLFEGLAPHEQKALLAALERAGGAVYRALAASEKDEIMAVELLSAAAREDANAELLEKHL